MAIGMRERAKVSAAESKALIALFGAWQDLKNLGWEEPRYFRFTEGKEFELIELGSTGIHRAIRRDGYVWVDGNWPSHPFLVREIVWEH